MTLKSLPNSSENDAKWGARSDAAGRAAPHFASFSPLFGRKFSVIWAPDLILTANGPYCGIRQRQDSNLRGRSPMDFESISLTTRTRCLCAGLLRCHWPRVITALCARVGRATRLV